MMIQRHSVVAAKLTDKTREALGTLAWRKPRVCYCRLRGTFWLSVPVNLQILDPHTSILGKRLVITENVFSRAL